MNYKHGQAKTATYESWCAMKRRCCDKNYRNWKYWGGRGITVCHLWKTFVNFFADMGERPKGLSLDRIDTNGNYEPNNCRWVTHTQQVRNTRIYKTNTSGAKGVCWFKDRRKWHSYISVNSKIINLGYFETIAQAAAARQAGVLKYWLF